MSEIHISLVDDTGDHNEFEWCDWCDAETLWNVDNSECEYDTDPVCLNCGMTVKEIEVNLAARRKRK